MSGNLERRYRRVLRLLPGWATLTLIAPFAGALIARGRYVQRVEHDISLACDEWNVWYRTDDGQL